MSRQKRSTALISEEETPDTEHATEIMILHCSPSLQTLLLPPPQSVTTTTVHESHQLPPLKRARVEYTEDEEWYRHVLHTMNSVIIPIAYGYGWITRLDTITSSLVFGNREFALHLLTKNDHHRHENCDYLWAACTADNLPLAKWTAHILSITPTELVFRIPLFITLCQRDRASIIQWLVSKCNITMATDFYTIITAFNVSCKEGSLNASKMLTKIFGLDRVNINHTDTFACTCAGGRIGVAMWMADAFKMTQQDARAGKNDALVRSCVNGHFHVAKWLIERFSLERSDITTRKNIIFRSCCSRGDLEMAQWLTKKFDLTVTEARAKYNESLRILCEKGNLTMAKWLVNIFGLTKNDVRARMCEALRTSCANGHIDVTNWLFDWFHFGVKDVRKYNLLNCACISGNLDVIKWLISKFQLDRIDICFFENYAFRISCENNQFETAKWIADTFNFGPDDVKAANNDAVRKSAMRNSLRMVKWLVKRFKLNLEDVAGPANELIQREYVFRCYGIVQWLSKHFGFQAPPQPPQYV
jgi:hypothetical protein